MQDLWVIHEQENNRRDPSTMPHCERRDGELTIDMLCQGPLASSNRWQNLFLLLKGGVPEKGWEIIALPWHAGQGHIISHEFMYYYGSEGPNFLEEVHVAFNPIAYLSNKQDGATVRKEVTCFRGNRFLKSQWDDNDLKSSPFSIALSYTKGYFRNAFADKHQQKSVSVCAKTLFDNALRAC